MEKVGGRSEQGRSSLPASCMDLLYIRGGPVCRVVDLLSALSFIRQTGTSDRPG